MKLKLELDVDEINLALQLLSEAPYNKVYTLIANISKQAKEQQEKQNG